MKSLPSALKLTHYQQIPVLELNHFVGRARIALQGAQLLNWQPRGKDEQLWLSEIEPFQLGNPIRGGIPICYPWFGNKMQPAHGFARIQLWQLSEAIVETAQVRLKFSLFSTAQTLLAQLEMTFDRSCQLRFTHFGEQPAQLALHSYFKVNDIAQLQLHNLGKLCFNALTQQQENVATPRLVDRHIDCIYPVDNPITLLQEGERKRQITHINASDIVLWNPWQTPTAQMSPQAYRQMICIETARLHHPLNQNESLVLRIDEWGEGL